MSQTPVTESTLSPSGRFTQPGTATTTNHAPVQTLAALLQTLKVEALSSNRFRIGRVAFDRQQRTVQIPGRVKNRDLVIEYALVTEQGKAYESLLTTDASPIDIHLACLLLGAGQGSVGGAFRQAAPVPETNAVHIEVSWETNSQPVHFALSALVCLTASLPETATPTLGVEKWLYNGSGFDASGFAAQREGSIISLIRDAAALVNNPAEDRDNDAIHWPNAKLLPAEGWPVQVTLRFPSRRR
ncbi:MAG TPA: YdjY domain-containing protein [Bacillota bacterium]|nr:YdjY domain-containing protein [Bacillota bacterium]